MNALEVMLNQLVLADNRRVSVKVEPKVRGTQVVYTRRADPSLIEKIRALPEEVRRKCGWDAKDYFAKLEAYEFPITADISGEKTLGGNPNTGFVVYFACRAPLGLDETGCMQLGVNLGNFDRNDLLCAPSIECRQGHLLVRAFYSGEPSNLDQPFASRLYRAFETINEAVSIFSELSYRADEALKGIKK